MKKRRVKVIEIDNCWECPHCDTRTLTPYCEELTDYNIRKDGKIPRFCPLDEEHDPFMPDKKFVLFVDGMDGDVIQGFEALGDMVKHALKHGAKKLEIRMWRPHEKSRRMLRSGR